MRQERLRGALDLVSLQTRLAPFFEVIGPAPIDKAHAAAAEAYIGSLPSYFNGDIRAIHEPGQMPLTASELEHEWVTGWIGGSAAVPTVVSPTAPQPERALPLSDVVSTARSASAELTHLLACAATAAAEEESRGATVMHSALVDAQASIDTALNKLRRALGLALSRGGGTGGRRAHAATARSAAEVGASSAGHADVVIPATHISPREYSKGLCVLYFSHPAWTSAAAVAAAVVAAPVAAGVEARLLRP